MDEADGELGVVGVELDEGGSIRVEEREESGASHVSMSSRGTGLARLTQR